MPSGNENLPIAQLCVDPKIVKGGIERPILPTRRNAPQDESGWKRRLSFN
jgi:hypothetical protein